VWIVRLKPRGSVSPELRSDTLFGCIAWAAVALEGPRRVEAWLTAFEDGDPPFLLSSTFPYQEGSAGGRVYFLPRPLHWPRLPEPRTLEEYRSRKKMKKRRYVPQDTFARVIRGESDAQPSGEAPRLQPEPVLHNRINRLTWGTTDPGRLFYQEQLFLPTNTGLYFLLDVLHESETGLLRACLHLLGHLGWGGNSVSGMNHFTVEIEEKAEDFLPRVDSPTHFVTLSLYFPKPRERGHFAAHADRCWYELVWRRGKIGGRFFPSGHFWKRAVNYFVEGSVFPLIDGALGCFGCNPLVKAVELKSPYGALRQVRSFGMAFAVPAKVTGVQE